MNGTSSPTRAGEIISASMPHAFADDIRRCSSSTRACSRAISMPPHVVSTPSFSYWRIDSSVR